MMDKLARLIEKKKLRPLDEDEQAAKLGVIDELRGAAKEAMGGRVKGLKQVKVASDSKEGLKAGLEKAEEVLESSEDSDDDLEHAAHEAMESPEKEMSEHKSIDEMDEDELDEKLKELMERKEQLKLKKGM